MLKATDEEIEDVREYFEWQAPDLEVTFMQKVYSEAVLNTCHDVWDIHTCHDVWDIHTNKRTFGAEPKINNCNNAVFSLSIPHREPETCRFQSPGATGTRRENHALNPSHPTPGRYPQTAAAELLTFAIPVSRASVSASCRRAASATSSTTNPAGSASGTPSVTPVRSLWTVPAPGQEALLAARQGGNADNPDTRDPIPFEAVADEVFQRYGRRWKPRTLAVNLSYYRNQILPWFKGKPISDITRRDVLQWHASLHGVPFAADSSAPILSVIFKQAEAYGYRLEGSNPCTGIRRYRRGGRERFLSVEEMRRLSKVLDRHQDRHPVEASIVRLLLLTGCRKSEILTLQWSEYREGRLYLSDSKTGPRTVWLSSAARKVLDDLPRTDPWMFPSSRGQWAHFDKTFSPVSG